MNSLFVFFILKNKDVIHFELDFDEKRFDLSVTKGGKGKKEEIGGFFLGKKEKVVGKPPSLSSSDEDEEMRLNQEYFPFICVTGGDAQVKFV